MAGHFERDIKSTSTHLPLEDLSCGYLLTVIYLCHYDYICVWLLFDAC